MKKCEHLWITNNTYPWKWDCGVQGTLVCAKCLSVCRYRQESNNSPIEIIEILDAIKTSHEEVKK